MTSLDPVPGRWYVFEESRQEMAGPRRKGAFQRVSGGEPDRGPANRHPAGSGGSRAGADRSVAKAGADVPADSQGAVAGRVAASRNSRSAAARLAPAGSNLA